MSFTLTLLAWSTTLIAGYVLIQSLAYQLDVGVTHGAGPRDNERPLGKMAGRSRRALDNLGQTYAVFVALSLALELSGRADGLSFWGGQLYFWARWVYLPSYLIGVPYVRSLCWLVSVLGLALMFFAVVI
ncbi:MAPEG family protein [Devosia rhodophyticola]|uniref:MAPEG family protein n=1 Tax=Devosia rhodophyticola TaxID=3026423 RepID=A0ABY7YUE1_9HYPH|nr:MAPEG family protein [Devosia rhodophyticola]WDR04470.1 MAPEG family protein [Devosia rhodophyticola]